MSEVFGKSWQFYKDKSKTLLSLNSADKQLFARSKAGMEVIDITTYHVTSTGKEFNHIPNVALHNASLDLAKTL